MTDEQNDERKGVGIGSTIKSVASAAFGVQSSKNQERDFKKGKASHFIIAGIIFTLIFMGTVFTIVRTVLENAK